MSEQNPYSSPEAVVADLSGGNLAGRWERLGAAILDTVILMAILFPLMFVGGYWRLVTESGGQVPIATTLLWAAIGFAVFAAVQWVPLNAGGQT